MGCNSIHHHKNAWRKVKRIQVLEQDEEVDAKELDDAMFDEILQELSSFNITEQDMNEFLNSDNDNGLE
jgi:hypothetical protein